MITGIKGHLNSPAGKEDTRLNSGINPVSTELNFGIKKAVAEGVTEYFAELGLGPDRVKQLAELADQIKILGKIASFTPQIPLGQDTQYC